VSSSQAVVGAVIGLGLVRGFKGVHQIRWKVIFNIASGWISTPIIAGAACLVMLFFVQNVFQQQVYRETPFVLSSPVMEKLESSGIQTQNLQELKDREIATAYDFRRALRQQVTLDSEEEELVIASAQIFPTYLDDTRIAAIKKEYMTTGQIEAIERLAGQSFTHKWQLQDALAALSDDWKAKGDERLNKAHNQMLQERLDYVFRTFHTGNVP
jgi:PiT family inorganic phosphate transporter